MTSGPVHLSLLVRVQDTSHESTPPDEEPLHTVQVLNARLYYRNPTALFAKGDLVQITVSHHSEPLQCPSPKNSSTPESSSNPP